MKTILSFLAIITALNMTAQNSWKVYLGKKELLSTGSSDEAKNIIVLTGNDLKGGAELVVTFHEAEPQKDWQRIFSIAGDSDTELVRKEGVRMLKIPATDLSNYFQTHRQLKIYTWSLPLDPELAARIRIRRVYLCTVEKK